MSATVRFLVTVLLLALPAAGWAYDGPVEKKTFAMPSYATVGGATIKDVRVGYETYGTLNAARDNVVLVTHLLSGTSHAAGKYRPTDAAPGYWDGIIGAGKPVDTGRFFVVSSDTLVNLNVKDPTVVTTGPASVDPDTGKPYGMKFPIVTIRDFVNVQKALLDTLGVRRLHAIIGPAMGAFQALEWAAAYPAMVERIVPIGGGAEFHGFTVGWANAWASPILLDPRWNRGDYYGKDEPVDGLALAFKIVTLHARHPGWAQRTFGRKWAAPDRDPAKSFDNKFAIETTLDSIAAGRARVSDANSFLYLVKANQLFVTGQKGSMAEGLRDVRARTLLIPVASDLIVFPEFVRQTADVLRRDGRHVEVFEIEGDGGHLDGVLAIGKAGEAIRKFLAQ
jgi:homoserine O-acetyltransferase